MTLFCLLLTVAGTDPAAVPFEVLRTRHMVVSVHVNGKGPYRLLFDTGAPLNIVSKTLARDCVLEADSGRRVAIRSLEAGPLKVADLPVVVMDHPAVAALSRIDGPIDGILGFPFFARYRMTLDYQASQLTFVPSGFEAPDILQALLQVLTAEDRPTTRLLAPAAQWGLVVDKGADDEEAGVTVRMVRADSAAAGAGLRPGDRLLTIDGRWTDSVADCYEAAGQVAAGQTVPVTVRRVGREIRLLVRPRAGL